MTWLTGFLHVQYPSNNKKKLKKVFNIIKCLINILSSNQYFFFSSWKRARIFMDRNYWWSTKVTVTLGYSSFLMTVLSFIFFVRSKNSCPAGDLFLLLPNTVHPSVDRVFLNYMKCMCAVRQRLYMFKNSLCTARLKTWFHCVERQSLLEGL